MSVKGGIGPAPTLLSSTLAAPVEGFAPLWFRNELIGAVSPAWLAHLDPRLFKADENAGDGLPEIRIRGGDRRSESGLVPTATLNRWLLDWAESLKGRGLLPGWRGETVHVYGANEAEPLLSVERSLLRPLGLMLRTVQVNVFTVQDKRLRVWIARRANHKPVDAGKLDALVGGGIAGDETPLETLVRECAEEAGMTRAMARRAVPVGVIDSIRPAGDGAARVLHRERLMLYDLKVAPEFTPVPADGESAEVMCLSPRRLEAAFVAEPWSDEGAWATRDLLSRRAGAASAKPGTPPPMKP
jgi:8-oxo-dGTP pyrophosphatase MutT (NUDIX family)